MARHIGRSSPALYKPLSSEDALAHLMVLEQRFGIPCSELMARYHLHRPNSKQLLLVAKDCDPPERPAPTSVGMPFMSVNMQFPKLTTSATMLVGHWATKHVVELDQAQCALYFSRQEFEPASAQLVGCERSGYVILKYAGYPVGQGFWSPGDDQKPHKVSSLYPKAGANRPGREVF